MTPKKVTPKKVTNETLKHAASFLRRHSKDPRVGSTYGYFTRHPVAPLNRKRLILLLEQLDSISEELKRSLRVVDLACGGGIITCAIAMGGHRALGLDLSSEEIHLAKLFALEEGLEGVFQQTDLMQEESWEAQAELILGGKPDVVVLAYALHHLPDAEAFIERVSRWLPPGARLLINEENPESALFRLKHRVRTWIQKDTETEWHRSYEQWKKMIEARQFQVAPALGADLMPGLARVAPGQSWSLVFTADRR